MDELRLGIYSKSVLEKYINNEPARRDELFHWLVNLPCLIEKLSGADEEIDSFAKFYVDTAMPFVKKAIQKKLGFKDAIYYVNYNVLNTIHKGCDNKVTMQNVIDIEKKNFKEVLNFIKKMKWEN